MMFGDPAQEDLSQYTSRFRHTSRCIHEAAREGTRGFVDDDCALLLTI
jgi:hypothetical protein